MQSDHRQPVVALLAANLISQIGNGFSTLAIPLFVLATTGSASQTGIVVAVGFVPHILVGIFGGAIVDRLGYRKSSIISDILSGLSVLMIPMLYQTVGLAFWQLLVLVFLGAALDGPGMTARLALFPELVQRTRISLERANAGYQTTRRIAGLLGPPFAGILIAAIGPANLLWFNAATFAVSAAIVAFAIPVIPTDLPRTGIGGIRAYADEVREGFRFLFSNKLLLWMIVSFSAGSLVAEPLYAIILPVYANDVLGSAAQLGFIFSALGAGSLVGNLVYITAGSRFSRTTLLLGGFAIRAGAFAVLLTMPPWWVVAAAIFIGAVALEPINPMRMSIMQEQVPPGMRGRVFGAESAIHVGTLPLGIVVYGFLMGSLGLQTTLVIFVIVNCALPIGMALIPALRDIQRPGTPEPGTSRSASMS